MLSNVETGFEMEFPFKDLLVKKNPQPPPLHRGAGRGAQAGASSAVLRGGGGAS